MKPIDLTPENFQSEVLQSAVPVLVDFWAPWCAPCRAFSPVIEEIAEEATGFKVGKVNVDDQPELAAAFKVMSIPTLILFKNGAPAARTVGLQSKEKVLELLR
ncbi:MAG: thioredoxin [Pyramidobacter sp.]|jgi:thioredoxin 1